MKRTLTQVPRTPAISLVAALGSSFGALALSLLLRTLIAQTIFVFFFAAIPVAAWFGGFPASLFVVVFGVLAVNYIFLEPVATIHIGAQGIFSIVVFSATAFFISWVVSQFQVAKHEAEDRAEQLHDQTVELETQMEENQALTEELETTNEELLNSLREAEEARAVAEQANRSKSEFLAVMSHELRTPLNAIVGYADLLDTGIAGPLEPAQKAHLARIRSSSWHLLDLIQEVLSFSRIEAGRETIRVADVDVVKLARDAVSYIQPQAVEKGLHVDIEAPLESIVVITDPARLRQILLNLLSNAVKFTETGGLGLRVARELDGVRFEVWDTGVGIDGNHHDMIFEPFTQVDQSMTREKGGTGLGLPVSRKLAHLLGGSLEVNSQRGKGSTFIVHMPLKAPLGVGDAQ